MSTPETPLEDGRFAALPPWLRPREVELAGLGQLRLIETTVLVLVGLLLAIATINDVGRQVNVNDRLIADLSTWRSYSGHDYKNISPDEELLGAASKREVVCGNTSAGAPKSRTQLCLMIWGPIVDGKRKVHGGWYLPARTEDDSRGVRYGCFGEASQGFCPR